MPSVTKMVTATTAQRLVERGEVRLDQPLTEVLPAGHRTSALTGAQTPHHLLATGYRYGRVLSGRLTAGDRHLLTPSVDSADTRR